MKGIAKIFGAKGVSYILGTITIESDTPENRIKLRSRLFTEYPRLHFFVITEDKPKLNYRNGKI